MKRIILIAVLFAFGYAGYSQTLIGLYGGAGLATSNNYDVGISGGLDFAKGLFNKTWVGASLFAQGYSLYYDNEANSQQHGTGYAGNILRYKSNYLFIAPKLIHDLDRRGFIAFYVDAGIGFKIGGYDSLRKWNHSYDSTSVGRFDSTLDVSKNMTSMLVRVGTGFTEYIHIGSGNWWFSITEDFGFLFNTLATTTGAVSPADVPYSAQKLSPGYVSLQIGIAHYKLKNR